MQLNNKQIIEIWRRIKNDNSITSKITAAAREFIRIFVTCNPTVGFLVYQHGSDTPEFKQKFTDFNVKECRYFVPLMAKPRPNDLLPAKKVYDGNTLGAAIGEEVLKNLEEMTKGSKHGD